MNVSVARLMKKAWNLKGNRKWPYILLLLVSFLGFLHYATLPDFMENAKPEREPTQNNIAFVMQLEHGKVQNRLIYRFRECLASICQHSSVGLTIHVFANSMGKNESTKVLDVLAANCSRGFKVNFYDIERVLRKLLPSINVIKVSDLHVNCELMTI